MPTTAIDVQSMQKAAGSASRLMKVLANQDRLLLLCELSQGERCVSELEERLEIHQPTLSQQLTVLREEALVETRREGKQIYYRVASSQALAILKALHDQFCGTKRRR